MKERGIGAAVAIVIVIAVVVVAVAIIGGFLLLRGGSNTYRLVAVSNSMKHNTEEWRNYFLDIGYDSQTIASFQCQNGFERGDTLVIERYDSHSTTLNVGDVIHFKGPYDNNDIFHRIVEIIHDNQVLYRTKGDANAYPDQYLIPADQVMGKIASVIHSGGSESVTG